MSYFRKFIRNYAQVAKPLTDLTRGYPHKITWSKKAQDSLDPIEKAVISEPILSLPDFQTGEYVVTTDASSKRIGAILSQIISRDEKVRVCSSYPNPQWKQLFSYPAWIIVNHTLTR